MKNNYQWYQFAVTLAAIIFMFGQPMRAYAEPLLSVAFGREELSFQITGPINPDGVRLQLQGVTLDPPVITYDDGIATVTYMVPLYGILLKGEPPPPSDRAPGTALFRMTIVDLAAGRSQVTIRTGFSSVDFFTGQIDKFQSMTPAQLTNADVALGAAAVIVNSTSTLPAAKSPASGSTNSDAIWSHRWYVQVSPL